MMKQDSVKIEDPFLFSSLDHYSTSHDTLLREMLEYSDSGDKSSSSLGFMDLLNMQDFGPSLFDDALPPSLQEPSIQYPVHNMNSKQELNAPATPNSSSISSESNDEHPKEGLLDGEEPEDEDDEDEDKKTANKKQLKPKKASQKRKREPRFAFMTKSEVDHLEDGYRWRKYGQKAVKNSAFPRSYYRCTSASCNVKKRVERCWNDPSIVVTTYEGQHTHPSPMMMQRTPPAAAWHSGFSANPTIPAPTQQGFLFGIGGAQQQPSSHHQLLLTADHGLLQDVVPSSLIKKERN